MTLALEKPNAWACCSSSIWNLPRLIVASKLTQMQESGIFHPVPAHPDYWIIGLLKGWLSPSSLQQDTSKIYMDLHKI